MTLNVAAKNGIVIATVTGITTLMLSISQILSLHRMLTPETNEWYYTKKRLVEDATILTVALLTTLLSILMCVGIVKKRCLLLATWLAAAFPIACYLCGESLYSALKWGYFDHYVKSTLMIGFGFVFIYPICQLYLEMRREIAANKKYIEPK